MASLQTPRLLLRPWTDDDLPAFAALNADPRVMEFFPKTLSRAESDAQAARFRQALDQAGYGFWAVERIGGAPFMGFVGITAPSFTAHFTPCVEIGWRLAAEHWGQGYATEAARAALRFAFDTLRLEEVVSFTAVNNRRSRAVMERLGMTRSPDDDFDHPNVAVGHPLRRHVLYRIAAPRT